MARQPRPATSSRRPHGMAHTNSPVTICEYPIQNQCNACTSAAAGTHAPQVAAANTGGEGVKPDAPVLEVALARQRL